MNTAERPGYALPLLLLGGFRMIIDALHRELAVRGHPDVRPVHGFALQALGAEGATIGELGRRLGITKQAAAKTALGLEALGYIRRDEVSGDRRARHLQLTARGTDMLTQSAEVLADIRATWRQELGSRQLDSLEDSLDRVTGGTDRALRVDLPGWLGG